MTDLAIAERTKKSTELTDAEHAAQWLSRFDEALQAANANNLGELFAHDTHWRDLLAFTWNISPCDSRESIVATLLHEQPRVQASGFRVAQGHVAPRRVMRAGDVEVIEAIFEFETSFGRGLGVLRLLTKDPRQAWVLSTSLQELKGHEPAIGPRRVDGGDARIFGGTPWGKRREQELRYDDREPTVLIAGGGHNALMIAARLRLLGIDALCIERLPNVGDGWRRRYGSLALHNEVHLNHMPYLPFPPSWPRYLTKDMLGDWLEAYAKVMNCNVWTHTEFVEGRYDEQRGVWNARVRRADGSERVFHPRHLVIANGGVVGDPKMPDLTGLSDFKGEVMHSYSFDSGAPWRGKKVLIVGVGNTAHDIAQDLHGHGAQVKMIQRGSITVFSVKAASLNHGVYLREGTSIEDCDLIATAATLPVQKYGYQRATERMIEIDQRLHDGLRSVGFKLDYGPEGGGHQMKVRAQHGGYYLNVGCSDLIIKGEVGLLHHENVERFVAEGVLMKDGTIEKADLIIAATGFESPNVAVRKLLGDDIAEKIGPVWGLDESGELANMYKPTAQKGLWFTAGGFAQGRYWSHYISMQIKAREIGLVD